jgi:hypothetical protein
MHESPSSQREEGDFVWRLEVGSRTLDGIDGRWMVDAGVRQTPAFA